MCGLPGSEAVYFVLQKKTSGQMEALEEREVFLLFRLHPSIQTENTVAVFRGAALSSRRERGNS